MSKEAMILKRDGGGRVPVDRQVVVVVREIERCGLSGAALCGGMDRAHG